MFNVPYMYRHSKLGAGPGSVFPGELSARICGANQVIWMTARRDTLSGETGDIYPPCSGCVSNWKDQSAYSNNGTLLNSTDFSGDTAYWPDYWTGDTTNNNQPFISFDNTIFGPNEPNSLNIPYDPSFANLTEFTFTTIFRVRQIEPNSKTTPDTQSVLFENGFDPAGTRTDGWGIDVAGNDLRCWFYSTGAKINESIFTITDWTDWLRLTVRVSGDTIEANLFNETEFIGNSGFTWNPGDENGDGYTVNYGGLRNWWISAREGLGFPDSGFNAHFAQAGSWDISEYALYNSWLSDSCVNALWNYYDFRYGIANLQPQPAPSPPSAPGTPLMDLDSTYNLYSDNGVTPVTNGDDIYLWSDKTSNNNDAYQTDANTRPKWFASGHNGRPYVDNHWFNSGFDGDHLFVENTGQFDTQELTIFVVYEVNGAPLSSGDCLISNACASGSSVNADGWDIVATTPSTPEWAFKMEDFFSDGTNSGLSADTTQALCYRFSAGTSGYNKFRVNNEADVNGSAVATSIDYGDAVNLMIGGRYSTDTPVCNGSSNNLDMELYRMVIYDTYLDDTTVTNFMNDLNNYHNLF